MALIRSFAGFETGVALLVGRLYLRVLMEAE
jgi:hypothetical protein